MAIPIAAVQSIAALDPHGDKNTVAQRWKKWILSFELFSSATGCKDDKRKIDFLLHTAGPDVQDIFTLVETAEDYKEAKHKLDEYFSPRRNVSY